MSEQVASSVQGDMQEALIILNDERAAETFERVCANCRVHQVASQRVGVAACSPSELSRLSSIPGVTVVTSSD